MLRLFFYSPNLVYLYDLQTSIVKNFSVAPIKSGFGNDFLLLTIFEIFQLYKKHAKLKGMFPYGLLFEKFASNRPFIWNHYQTIKQ